MEIEQNTVIRAAGDDPVSETVIFAVAAARDVNPMELETPLFDAIDTDALDRLFADGGRRSRAGELRVEFTWAGCDVIVSGSGRVVVIPPVTGAEDAPSVATTK